MDLRKKSDTRSYIFDSSDDDLDSTPKKRGGAVRKLEEQFRDEESERKRKYHVAYRAKMSPTQKDKCRQQSRERVRRYRDRRQSERDKHLKTRLGQKKEVEHSSRQREIWRESKRRTLADPKKRSEINTKRRNKYAEMKAMKQGKGKVLRIPETPEKYAQVIEDLLKSATPRKQMALEKKGLFISSKPADVQAINKKLSICLEREMKRLQVSRKDKDRLRLQYLIKICAARRKVQRNHMRFALNLTYRTMKKYSDIDLKRKERSDVLSDDDIVSIENLYLENSTPLAQKKTVSKQGKQKRILNMTIKKLHSKCKSKVSLSKFTQLKCKNILTVNKHKFANCLCDICLNVSNKVRALRAQFQKASIKISDKYDIMKATMCIPSADKPLDISCIKRSCKKCGVDLLKAILQPLKIADSITWQVWETKKFVPKSKEGELKKGQGIVKQVLVQKTDCLAILFEELFKELIIFPQHILNAQFQQEQYSLLKENLPDNWLLSIEDYAENWRTVYQDEPQAAHFSYEQATILTKVGHYKCPKCSHLVTESAAFISDDLIHDSHVVHEANKIFSEHIKNRGVKVENHVIFSDGCSSQFKSKIPFKYVADSAENFAYPIERSYFGSKHGKSQCDALGGFIKKKALLHVLSRSGLLQSARDLFDFAVENLSQEVDCDKHFSRKFFYLSNIVRPHDMDPNPLKGTLKVHQIKSSGANTLSFRELSCFCSECLSGQYVSCRNQSYTGVWKTHNLLKKKKESRKKVKPKSPVVSKSKETPTKKVEQVTGEVELEGHTEEVDIISSTPTIEGHTEN